MEWDGFFVPRFATTRGYDDEDKDDADED